MDSGRYLFPSLRGGRGCVILILRIRRGSLACDLHTPCPLSRGEGILYNLTLIVVPPWRTR